MPDNREDEKRRATTVTVQNEAMLEGVVLTRCYFECPRCMSLKPARDFGLRLVEGRTLRNQSHCRACRSEQQT